MRMHKHGLTAMTLGVLAATGFAAASAFAAPVLTADSTATSNGISGTTVPSIQPGYIGSSTGASGALGEAQGYSFARDNGAYAVSTYSAGKATSTANAQYLTTLTNATGVAQRYAMSFHIYHGFIDTNYNRGYESGSLDVPEFLTASYVARVLVGGTRIFNSEASITRTATGSTWSKTGEDLDALDDGSDGIYDWNDAYFTLDLGILAAGASVDVAAQVGTATSADVGVYTYTPTGMCGYNTCGPIDTFKGTAQAFYGDPIDFSISEQAGDNGGSVPITFAATPATDVPEPTSLALAALGLGLAGWGRRRRARPA